MTSSILEYFPIHHALLLNTLKIQKSDNQQIKEATPLKQNQYNAFTARKRTKRGTKAMVWHDQNINIIPTYQCFGLVISMLQLVCCIKRA